MAIRPAGRGPVPPELGNLQDLRVLWLDGNRLTGEAPSSLTSLGNIVAGELW